MEKIIYPLKNMWITQVPTQGTHKYSQALDDQGLNYATIDKVYAPFTGKIVRKYPSECEIWFESVDKVEFADGTIDYATILFAHRDKYDDLKENFVYKQGEVIYSEGTKGANKIGGAQRHLHFECCAGKTTGSGWAPAKDGTWNLVNGKAPQNCYFITDETNVIKTGGLTFKKISSRVGTPVERNEYVYQLEVIAEVLNARDKATTSGKRLGYINKGIYNILNTTTADGYTWFEVEPSVWIAYNEEWEKIYAKKETEEEKLKKQITSLEATNKQLQDNINQLQNANAQLNNEIVSLKNKLKQINELSKV